MKLIKTLAGALAIGVLFCGTLISNSFGQAYPFPQNITYAYGKMPTAASSADALAAYNSWKTDYVRDAPCGGKLVLFDNPSHTVSEGIGYGMLLAAYAGDKTTFDGLWQFYQTKMNGNGVMHWKVNVSNCNTVEFNGASDAELDVAMALYVADWQWTGYMSDCQAMVAAIKQHEVDNAASGHGRYTLKPGDQFGGHHTSALHNDITNPSYFSPAYYRVFALVDGDATFWNKLAADGYELINLAKNNSTGLVPDWCKGSDGSFATDPIVNNYYQNGQTFYFDAIRTPFRSAVDYLWWGTTEAKTYCELVSDWVISQNGSPGTNNMGSGYNLDGTQFNTDHSNTFVGCFAVTAMATDRFAGQYQTHVDNAYNDDKNTNAPAGQYFNSTLKAITLFIMSGNFYLPPPDVCAEPDLGVDVSLCSGTKILDTGLPADGSRTFTWRRNGAIVQAASTSANTYTATQAGVYQVQTDESGCIRRSTVEVYPAAPTADFTYQVQGVQGIFESTSSSGVTSWTWDYGDAAGGSGDSVAHNYSVGAGCSIFDVELTVQDECSNTDVVTQSVPVCVGADGGWNTNSFKHVDGDEYPVLDADIVVTEESLCSELRIEVPAGSGAGQYSQAGYVFNDGGAATTQKMGNYPFVTIRIKSTDAITLRVDLGDNQTNTCNAGTTPCATSKVPVTVDLPGDDTYHTYTLNYTGKFINYEDIAVDADNIRQIAFLPRYDDQTWTGTITLDWMIVGWDNIDKPYINPTDASFCAGGDVVLDPVDCHATSYSWNTGETTKSITVDQPGQYCVTASNFGGDSTACMNVTETPAASAGFSATVSDLDVDFSNGSIGALTYSWDFGDGTGVSSLPNPSYSYATAGTYNVCLTANNAICASSDIECQDVIVTEPCITPGDAGAFTAGPTAVCTDDGCVTYSIAAVTGATTYNWTVPAGAVICAGDNTNSVTIDFAASASGDVIVEPATGCATGATSSVTVTVNTPPSILTTTNNGPVCSGESLTLNATATGTAPTFAWTGPNTYVGTGASPTVSVAATTAMSGIYSVTATENGCSSTASTTTATVNASPTTSNISGLATVCENETGVSYSVTNTGGSSYAWNVTGSGTQASGGTTNSITVDFTTGASSVQVTETNAAGCIGAMVSLAVNTQTCVGLTANFSASTTTVCEGETVTFTDASTGTSGATVYAWDFGTGATPATANTAGPHVVTYATAGTPSASLTLTDGTTDNHSENITVNALPTTSAITGATAVCDNTTGEPYSVTTTAGSSYSWTVSGSGTQASGGTTNAITVDFTTGGATIDVVETTAAGCGGSIISTSVTASSCINLVAGITASTSTVCEGETVTFTDASTGTSGSTVYAWDFGAGATPPTASTPGPHVVTYSNAGAISVTLDISEGVENDNTSEPITVNAAAVTSPITGLSSVCDNATGQAYSVTNTAGSSYAWVVTGSGTQASGGTTSAITVDYTTGAANIQVTETTAGGCVGSPVSLGTNASSCTTLTANFSAAPASVCEGGSITFTDASSGTNGSSTYDWDFGTGATPTTATGAGPHVVTYASAGTPNVTLNVANSAVAQNGAFTTYGKDDFASATEYNVAGKGVFWWVGATAGAEYALTRDDANSRLDISVTGASPTYEGFGLSFGDSNGDGSGTPYSIDLSNTSAGTANIHLDITNTHATEEAILSFSLQDINGNNVEILYEPYGDITWGNQWKKAQAVVPANTTQTVDIDMTGAFIAVSYGCGTAVDCPTVDSTTFDWTQVTGMGVNVNGGAGVDIPNNPFTGNIYFADFQLGQATSESDSYVSNVTVEAGPTTSAITGNTFVCKNATGVGYTVTNNTGSTYSWNVTGATIASGAGTSSITVDYTTSHATISVTETSSAGCVGTTSELGTTAQDCGTGGPTAAFTPSTTTVCEGEIVTFTDASTGAGITHAWDFGTGATPATATGVGPHDVTYSTAGSSNATLTVTTPGGTANGAFSNYAKDDFASATSYDDGAGFGVYWWPATATSIYSLTRDDANGRLQIDATAADPAYETFGLGFGDSNGDGTGTSYSIDLSGNADGTANLHLVVTNTHGTEEALVTFSLTDINGNNAEILYEDPNGISWGNQWKKAIATVPAGVTQTVDLDLTKALRATSWGCGTAIDCPTVDSTSFDWTQVTGVGVHINGGAGTDIPNPAFTGTIYFEDFMLGQAPASSSGTDNTSTLITVNAPATTTAITGQTTACENETGVTYTADGDAGSSYVWNVTGGTITSGAGTNSITVDFATTNATIDVTETTAAGCAGTLVSTSVTVSSCVGLSANFTMDQTSICEGQTVTFTDASTGTSGTQTYAWDFGAGATPATASTAGPHTVTYATAGTPTVSLTVTDGSSDVHTDNVTVTVCGGPLTADFTSDVTSVCEGQSVTFTDASTGTSGTQTYAWDFGTGATPATATTAGPHTVTYSTAGSIDVSLTVTEGTSDLESKTGFITVNAAGSLTASVSITGPTTICGSSGTYSATPTNGGASPSYQWYKNATMVGTNSAVYTDGSLTVGDAMYVEMTTSDACASPTVAQSNTITVSSTGGLGTPVVTGLKYPPCNTTQTYNVTASSATSTFIWDYPASYTVIAGGTSTDDFITFSFGASSVSGLVRVLEQDGACTSAWGARTVTACDTPPTAVGDDLTDVDISVYPNPFNDETHIVIESVVSELVNVEIYNVSGQLVYQGEYETNTKITVGTDLSNGVYIGQVVLDSRTANFKIVKQ